MDADMIYLVVFWFCVAAIGYSTIGYPLLLVVIGKVTKERGTSGRFTEELWPSVSIVVVAHNEEERMVPRVENLLACNYQGSVEILVVCDGCEDRTAERVRERFATEGVVVIEQERRGKPAGVNAAVAAAASAAIVLCAARQRFDQMALIHLVRPFADDEVAGVSGNLEIRASDGGASSGVDLYWKLEKLVRREESKIDSCIGCTGAIYAIRRSSFRSIPDDTLLDDVVIPMLATEQGGRVLFEPNAIAWDPQSLTLENEWRRKTRTMAGNFQMLFRHLRWLNPLRNRLWFQVISHKYLRLAVPGFMMAAFVSSAFLAVDSRFYQVLLGGQLALYLLAWIGIAGFGKRFRLVSITSGFVYLQVLCVAGFVRYLRSLGRTNGAWE